MNKEENVVPEQQTAPIEPQEPVKKKELDIKGPWDANAFTKDEDFEKELLKSDESLRPAIKKVRGVYRNIAHGIFGSEADLNMGLVLGTFPDSVMDLVGHMGKVGNTIDSFYDDVTASEGSRVKAARNVWSLIAPSLKGYGMIDAQTKSLPFVTKWTSRIGLNSTLDGAIGYYSDVNEGQMNSAYQLAETFPNWFGPDAKHLGGRLSIPEKHKTSPDMSPEEIREAHRNENAGIAFATDGAAFVLQYGKPAMNWFQAKSPLAKIFKQNEIIKHADTNLVETISKVDDQLTNLQIRKAELLEAIAIGKADKNLTKQQRFLISRDLKKVEETITQLSNSKKGIKTEIQQTGKSSASGGAAFEEHLKARETSRQVQIEESALDKLNADGAGAKGYDQDITPNFGPDDTKGVNTVTPGNVAENMVDSTSNYLGHTDGDNVSIITDNMLTKGWNIKDKNSRNAVVGLASEVERMGDWKALKNGLEYTRKDMSDAAFGMYNNIIHAGSVDEVKKLFQNNDEFKALFEGFETRQRTILPALAKVEIDADAQFHALKDLVNKFVGQNVVEQSARVMDTLGKDITNVAQTARELPEHLSDDKAMELILDKIEFLMTEYGINKASSSWMLKNKEKWKQAIEIGPDGKAVADDLSAKLNQVVEEQKQKAIAYRKVIEEAALEGPDVVKTFVDAFAVSDGDVTTIAGAYDLAWKYIRPKGLLYSSKATKNQLNIFAAAVKAHRMNMVLSGKAAINAARGSATSLVLRPIRAFMHAGLDTLKTGDINNLRKQAYLYGAVLETNRHALKDAWRMMKKVHNDPKAMLKAYRKDYVIRQEQQLDFVKNASKRWAREGNKGKEFSYNMAMNLHNLANHPNMKLALTAMTGVDSHVNTTLGHYWSRAKAYEEIGNKYGWPFTAHDLKKNRNVTVEGRFKKGTFSEPTDALLEAEQKHFSNFFDSEGFVKDDAVKYFAGEINLNLDHEWADVVTKATNKIPAAFGLAMFPRTTINDLVRKTSYIPFAEKLGPKWSRYTKVLTAGDDLEQIKEALRLHGIEDIDEFGRTDALNFYKYLKEDYQARHTFTQMLAGSLLAMAGGGFILNKAFDNPEISGLQARGLGKKSHKQRKNALLNHNIRQKNVTLPGTQVHIPFKGVEGIDPILSFYANLSDAARQTDDTTIQYLFDQSVFVLANEWLGDNIGAGGLEPLIAIVTDGDASGVTRWFANEVRSVAIPGGATMIANGTDGAFKDLNNELEKILMSKVPVLKSQVPSYQSIFKPDEEAAGHISNPVGRWAEALIGTGIHTTDGWTDELYDIGWSPNTILESIPASDVDLASGGTLILTVPERQWISEYIRENTNFSDNVKKIMSSKTWKKQVQQFRTERVRTHGATDKKEDLPLFQMLNKELLKAKKEAIQAFKATYPQYKQLFKLRVGAKDAFKRGDLDAQRKIREYEKENLKWNTWTEFLEYANPPKK